MTTTKSEELKDIAIKLNDILNVSPPDYFYLKAIFIALHKKANNSQPPTKRKRRSKEKNYERG